VADGEQALSLFHDARYEQGLIIFVDLAMTTTIDRATFRTYQFDICSEKYWAPCCGLHTAQKWWLLRRWRLELSEFAASSPRSAGVANDKLFLYSAD